MDGLSLSFLIVIGLAAICVVAAVSALIVYLVISGGPAVAGVLLTEAYFRRLENMNGQPSPLQTTMRQEELR